MTITHVPDIHMQNAADLLAQLDDIRGLDHIGAWPPGPGWWVILALVLLAIAYAARRILHARSWKGDARRTLQNLEDSITGANSREIAAALAETLRRIAITRFSRAEAAGLEGERWLEWLRKNDPRGFDWQKEGRLLIEAPYTPPGTPVLPDRVRAIARAAKAWVR